MNLDNDKLIELYSDLVYETIEGLYCAGYGDEWEDATVPERIDLINYNIHGEEERVRILAEHGISLFEIPDKIIDAVNKRYAKN